MSRAARLTQLANLALAYRRAVQAGNEPLQNQFGAQIDALENTRKPAK